MINAKQPSERVMLLNVILRRETFLQVGLGKLFWSFLFTNDFSNFINSYIIHIVGVNKINSILNIFMYLFIFIFKMLMGIGPNDGDIHSFLSDFET